ncbi:hypothetical protein [Nocardia harenae]|uniref:hypothetical protein n=1 Tax=Nocardia harenae TaxID=358707 RepID=UPI00082A883B|nr:hypothetical protein [Nocardia harenae]
MWNWSDRVAEHATAAACTRPVTDPEPTVTERSAQRETVTGGDAANDTRSGATRPEVADYGLAG